MLRWTIRNDEEIPKCAKIKMKKKAEIAEKWYNMF